MTKSTSAKLPHRKDSHKCPPRGCGKEHKCQATPEKGFTQGARATSCHFCWCAQKLPQNPCGQGQFWPPGREKNIKIASKSPTAGPVFAKTQISLSFSRVAHPAPYTNAGGKKKTKIARSRGGAQRNSYGHGTTSAQKARVAKKTMFFARASGRRKLARFSQGT